VLYCCIYKIIIASLDQDADNHLQRECCPKLLKSAIDLDSDEQSLEKKKEK